MQLKFDFNMAKHVVVSLSGGMDSSTLLLRALNEYKTVTALSFDYGQKHRVELDRAQSLIDYLSSNGYKVNYKQIQLNGLVDLLDSALVTGGEDVPEGHYAEDNMKATVVPNRNKIFASIIQAVALSVANKTEENTDIALGIHAGDHSVYPDCRQEFRDADDAAFRLGNWEAERVHYWTPYLLGDKFTILQDGEILCEKLGLDFDEVYKRTMTSYKPIKIVTSGFIQTSPGVENTKFTSPVVTWFSDYKSASSVERVEAFIKLGRKDPAPYADETGPVDYETARIYVEQILSEYEKEQLNIK
jgi:7-cyano-7-deazaguanine synthase